MKKVNINYHSKTKGENMDNITLVNYQGSKKNLLNFIHRSLDKYIREDDILLDIFAGTSSVAYSYKNMIRVYANDAEPYSAVMARALLGKRLKQTSLDSLNKKILNYKNPYYKYDEWISKERECLAKEDIQDLLSLYETIPTVWGGNNRFFSEKSEYSLFVKYYSTSYFGLEQARDIDAIRCAISNENQNDKDIFLSALFYAMKECVFSKDGHMAQPLDLRKNKTRLFKLRKKSICDFFFSKCQEFVNEGFVVSRFKNKVFNKNFEELLSEKYVQDATIIYADPPYTDMQYSRYYHLLNTVLEYDYPDMTVVRGEFTKGLYLENRFQSQLSKKSTCLKSMESLVKYSYNNNVLLAISFAFPQNIKEQKTDRYVMDIEELIQMCKKYYSDEKVKVMTQDYKHSNNRNSESKKVIEYLIICERDEKI